MNQKQKLVIFTRFPVPGETKTRLIPHLGEKGAARLQREMTEYTLRQARRTGVEIEIRYTGGSLDEMCGWLGDHVEYVEQGEGDLGERMERVFFEHFANGIERVVIIGSDCPTNDGENIKRAFLELDRADCVIGPAYDGGYYLIGLSKSAPVLFRGIDWGSDQVLKQTLAAASSLSVVQLKRLSDIDEPEDLPPRISVIIPTFNEAKLLPRTLERVVRGFRVEPLVVDGGSSDATRSIPPPCLECREGRAAQQNLGVQNATGEILLFLHADTLLPEGWEWAIRDTLAEPTVAAGAFAFRIKEQIQGLKFIEAATNWRSRVLSLPYGDQGLFLRRETFDALGGFPDMPIMEDYAFVHTLRRNGRVVTVPQSVLTSGRRWQRYGIIKVTLINGLMVLGYHLGIAPDKLSAFYRRR
jgi:rSAM/selenodomain-associated transferase 2/rSAM/selenodomain-associated transferase 1